MPTIHALARFLARPHGTLGRAWRPLVPALLAPAAAAALSACAPPDLSVDPIVRHDPGPIPPFFDAGYTPDAGPVDAGQPDAGGLDAGIVVDDTATLSGQVRHLGPGTPVPGATLNTFGVAPAGAATADAQGNYSMDVAPAGVFWLSAYDQGGIATMSLVTMPAGDATKNVYVLGRPAFDALAAAYGKTQQPGCGAVLASLKDTNGAPLSGVSGVSLYGQVDAEGPYFLAADGTGQAGLTATSASGQVAFFNVCNPQSQLINPNTTVQVRVAQTGYTAPYVDVQMLPAGVSLADVAVTVGDVPVEPDPEPIDFATEIVPVFNRGACAACHRTGGPAENSGLLFDQAPAALWQDLMEEGSYRVNLADPDASLVLSKPLLEEPPNHPNAAFLSTAAPDYVLVRRWIEQGAPYSVNGPPDVVEPIAFDADVYPILQVGLGGRGCTACHDADGPAGGLDLSGGPDAVYQRLQAGAQYNVFDPAASPLLTKPLYGALENHPVKVFVNTDDPDYQTIYQWILQGAVYDVVIDPNQPVYETNVDFTDNVWLRFVQRGCTGCHSAEQQAGGLSLQGAPGAVAQALTARVTPGDATGSTLLRKVLATYPDVNHGGGKPIPNVQDPFVRYVGGWIQENAVYTPKAPLDFDADIAPLFAAQGCTGCHGNNGGLTLSGTPAEVYDELFVENPLRASTNNVWQSLIFQKPIDILRAPQETHPVRVNGVLNTYTLYIARYLYQ